MSPDVFTRLNEAVHQLGWTDQRDQDAYNGALWQLAKATRDLGAEVRRLRNALEEQS